MKTIFFYFLSVLLLLTSCSNSGLQITNNKQSSYVIVIPAQASVHEQKAAEVLTDYINRISETTISVINDNEALPNKAILIGNTKYSTGIDFSTLNEDGFTIKTDDKHLYIAGGKAKGSLYGVYTLLEKYLGCRKYSPSETVVPKQVSIQLQANIEDTQNPRFQFRTINGKIEQEYRDWHKLDQVADGDWGLFVHTFHTLVPSEKYASQHPEYYALVNGSRMPGTQLCLSNPEVLKVLTENLRAKMAEKPNARYWSVSQNDNISYCTCPNCRAIDEAEGTPMGSVLQFVNKVAEQFPDKIISTLAYQYTRKVPKNTLPLKNVNIMLCNIECPRQLPLTEVCGDFCTDLEAWGKITNNILMWDYVVQFTNFMTPFPNIKTLQPNLQTFANNGVSEMFEQSNAANGNDFYELKTYLLAKLMWDPNADINQIYDDFFPGFYAESAPFVRQYFDTLHVASEQSGVTLNIYGSPVQAKDTYLSESRLDQYNELFNQAEQAAKSPEILERVKNMRLSIQYAALEIAQTLKPGSKYALFNADRTINPLIKTTLNDFHDQCLKDKVTLVNESGVSPDDYYGTYNRIIEGSSLDNLAAKGTITLITEPNQKYSGKGAQTLADGEFGSYNFSFNWLGWESKPMEFVVDLGKSCEITTIQMDFFHKLGDWIFRPDALIYYASSDGKNYTKLAEVKSTMPIDKQGVNIDILKAVFPKTTVRFIKVKSQNILKCPSWHGGAGGNAWIFADEIIVQ